MTKNIAKHIFIILSFIILLITMNLVIHRLFTSEQTDKILIDNGSNQSLAEIFIYLSYVFGLSSLTIIILSWINRRKIEFYMGILLLAQFLMLFLISLVILI